MNAVPPSETSLFDLRSQLESGEISSQRLVGQCLERIRAVDWNGPSIRSVIETNPDAEAIAAELDAERRERGERGPLHGIPILVKDNIDTADRMRTTAGSLALEGTYPSQDAHVASCLRRAGAILLGKANLSEWANFRSTNASTGWSARGGQCLNPHALDRSPGGSSSGSAAAVAAGFAPASLGTETDGSILSPAAACGVVGIKPTVGLTGRGGVIPISHTQDTVGVFGQSVRDAAVVLGAIVGEDPRDPATSLGASHSHSDYFPFLDDASLQGARIGVAREPYFTYSPKAARVADEALALIRDLGAVIVDPADIPTAREMEDSDAEHEVLLHEFKQGLNAYLRRRPGPGIRSLADLIRFNEAHADREMAYFGQEIFHLAQERGSLSDRVYRDALDKNRRLARVDGIDAVMNRYALDALVMPTGSPAIKIDLINGGRGYGGSSQPAAIAGYPAISVPAGQVSCLPVGITFMGRAWSEPTLIGFAYAFEQAAQARQAPRFVPVT